MAFKKHNKAYRNRKAHRGGRPTKEQRALKILAEKRARQLLEEKVDEIMGEYVRLAKGGRLKGRSSPATIRHAVDKLLPPIASVQHAGNIIFNNNLPSEED